MSLRPVGSLSPQVYWRRRVVVVVPIVVLIAVTCWVACSPDDGSNSSDGRNAAAATSPSGTNTAASGSPTPEGSASSGGGTPTASGATGSGAAADSATSTSVPTDPTSAVNTPAPGSTCVPTSLTISAVTSATSYAVGTEPVLLLQVTNNTPIPCTQDVADSQVELVVDGGSGRVWGSHDCTTQPGTNIATLQPNQPVQVSITWTGLSSQPGCAAQRQQVPAGTYTLHALLSGHEGATAQFAMT